MKIIYWYFFLLSIFAYSSASYANDEFPGRALYPAVPYIKINEFSDKFDDYEIIDIGSPYESDPLPIAIGGNDKTCMEYYKAVYKCKKIKF